MFGPRRELRPKRKYSEIVWLLMGRTAPHQHKRGRAHRTSEYLRPSYSGDLRLAWAAEKGTRPKAEYHHVLMATSSTAESELALPPGPRLPSPLQTLLVVSRPVGYLDECRRRYGPVFQVRVIGRPPIVYAAPTADAAERVYDSDQNAALRGAVREILQARGWRSLLGLASMASSGRSIGNCLIRCCARAS